MLSIPEIKFEAVMALSTPMLRLRSVVPVIFVALSILVKLWVVLLRSSRLAFV